MKARNSKKSLSISLVLVILCSFSSASMVKVCLAKDTGNVITSAEIYSNETGELINKGFLELKGNPIAYGFSNSDISNAYIGNAFQFGDMDGDILSKNSSLVMFPIVSNNKIIAIMSLTKYEGNLSCTIGKDFAPKLNEFFNTTSADDFVLISINNNLYAVDSNDNYYELFNSPRTSTNTIHSYISSRGFSEYNNIPDTDLLVKSEFIQKNDSLSENIPAKVVQTRNGVDYFLSDFPIVYQSLNGVNGPQYDICWAASIAAIVRYEKPNEYGSVTPLDVLNAIKHPIAGATWPAIMAGFNYYFTSPYLPTLIERPLNTLEFQEVIENNDPAQMGCLELNNTFAHQTVLCGLTMWNTSAEGDDSTTIRIMDPAYATFKTGVYKNGKYTFSFGSDTIYWDKTVRFYYN